MSTIYLATAPTDHEAPTVHSGRSWRKQILTIGNWRHPQDPARRLSITAELIAGMIRNFQAGIGGRVPLQRGHSEDYRDTIGDVRELIATADGLDAVIEVADADTERLIGEGKLRDVSSGFVLDYTDPRTGKRHGPRLHHVAAVLRPYLEGMRGFAPATLADGSLLVPVLLDEPAGSAVESDGDQRDAELLLRIPDLTEADLFEVHRLVTLGADRAPTIHPAGLPVEAVEEPSDAERDEIARLAEQARGLR